MQKMEAIGQLTGGIAHDFNNMLAVIMSAMNLIQRKLARGETDIGKFVDAATDATDRAASLTARLLAFSRQQPLAPQVVDANRIVTGMSDLLRRTLGETISVETVLAGGLWQTYADASQIENAILNLAVNGRDAMPDGGSLTIETANSHLDDGYAATHAEVAAGQYVMIAVTDTGVGMSPDVLAKAFEPFFTTKPVDKGTGLGLSQVFGFVKQSGGHVKIYSEPGEGTTVKIYLKRHFGDEQEMPAQQRRADPDKRPTETVLVVEDDARVRVGNSRCAARARLFGDPRRRRCGGAEASSTSIRTSRCCSPTSSCRCMNGRKLAEEALQAPARAEGALHHRLHQERRGAQWRARSGRQLPGQAVHARPARGEAARGARPVITQRRKCGPSGAGAIRRRGLRRNASALPAPASRRCGSRNRHSGSRR